MIFTASQIAEIIDGKVDGDPSIEVSKLSKIENGKKGSLTFLSNPKYTPFIYSTNASVTIVNESFIPEQDITTTLIRVKNAYDSFSQLLDYYEERIDIPKGISSSSEIHETSKIGKDCFVGSFSYIGKNCVIGDNVQIYPQSYISDNVHIGSNTIIRQGVKVLHNTIIGNCCVIHSGAIIGSDGFGFSPQNDGSFKKVPQTGNVIIKDFVDIGSNTTIDKATLGSTLISKGVKLDNLVQIAHNVIIGENTVIAAQTGIAGSAKIGNNCMIGGQVGVAGHITIGDNVKIQGQTGVTSNIKNGVSIQGTPAMIFKDYSKSYIYFRKFPDIVKRLENLEKQP